MKKTIIILVLFWFLISGCSINYLIDSSLSSNFNKNQPHKVLIIPVAVTGNYATQKSGLADQCYMTCLSQLMKLKNFTVIDKAYSTNSLNKFSVSGDNSMISPDIITKVAKDVGADLILKCKINQEEQNAPILAEITLLQQNTNVTMYYAKTRVPNPINTEAGAELAIETGFNNLK